MDKYQKYLLANVPTKSNLKNSDCNPWAEDKIILRQNEDIMIKDYVLSISNINIKSIYAIAGDTRNPFKIVDQEFYIPIDFEKKFDKIQIVFKNNLADDLILPVVYEEADKEAYYAKQEQEHRKALLSAASIKCATGADLVNIYFQPCCKDYDRTEIALYRDGQMLAKYKVEEDCFFKSIGGLAYGKYDFVLKQYDKAGMLLLETEQIPFYVSRAEQKPTVVI